MAATAAVCRTADGALASQSGIWGRVNGAADNLGERGQEFVQFIVPACVRACGAVMTEDGVRSTNGSDAFIRENGGGKILTYGVTEWFGNKMDLKAFV